MTGNENTKEAISTATSTKTRSYFWINFAGVSLGSLCLISGYSVLFFIQSSLHSKGGLGSISLSVDFAIQMIACFFLPPYLMRTIGCKWTIVASAICQSIFITANLTSSFETLIPASICLGVGYASMWATMNTVVADLATGYAALTGQSEASTLARFFSIFFVAVNSAAIWGNIISSQILSPQVINPDNNTSEPHVLCGAHYCDTDRPLQNNYNLSINHTDSKEVPQSEVINLVIAALALELLGSILTLSLLASYSPKSQQNLKSSMSSLLSTVRLLRNPNLLLLMICTINSGLMFSFLSADFTKAFVTCSIGISNVGLVVMSFGIALTLGTFVMVYVTAFIPRITLFLGAVVLNTADLLLMLFWTPDPEDTAVLYVIAGIWGLTFAVWLSQLLALYGDVFIGYHQEAYSSERIFNCVGFVIGFAWSHYLCMSVKIYCIFGFLVTGTIGYLLVERRLYRSRLQSINITIAAPD